VRILFEDLPSGAAGSLSIFDGSSHKKSSRPNLDISKIGAGVATVIFGFVAEFRLPQTKGPVIVEFSAYVVDINSINVEDMDFRYSYLN